MLFRSMKSSGKAAVSFIGSGNYATSVLIPAFKSAEAHMKSVASSAGVSGLHAGRRHGFCETTTDTEAIFADDDTDIVVITTRHDSHARYVLAAIKANKHVFVEKPLCLTLDELAEIKNAYRQKAQTGSLPQLMVGFNRRFAPQIQKMKELLAGVTEPASFVMTINAGAIPADHWTQDRQVGGGRIVGEVCHFIDLLRYLAASPIQSCQRSLMDSSTNDTLSLQLAFKNGSIGTVHYFANGPKSFPKERLEVFAAGGVLQLDNFRKMQGFNWPGFKKMNLSRQDKGQKACAKVFMDAVRDGGDAPICVDEIFEVSQLSIEMA